MLSDHIKVKLAKLNGIGSFFLDTINEYVLNQGVFPDVCIPKTIFLSVMTV